METTSDDITAHKEAWPVTTVPDLILYTIKSSSKVFSTIHGELQGTLLPRLPSQSPIPWAGWGKEEEEDQDEDWCQKQLSSHVFPNASLDEEELLAVRPWMDTRCDRFRGEKAAQHRYHLVLATIQHFNSLQFNSYFVVSQEF